MSKEELIEKLEYWAEQMKELKVFLESLRPETLVVQLFVHGAMGFLITGADYLEVNLTEIANRVRMS